MMPETQAALVAGRDLDARIAELLGGCRAHPEWYWFRNVVVEGVPDLPRLGGQGPVFAGPEFSAKIEAAWLVMGCGPFTLVPVRCEGGRTRWAALLWEASCPTDADREVYGFGDYVDDVDEVIRLGDVQDTAPLAICAAALRAKGGGR